MVSDFENLLAINIVCTVCYLLVISVQFLFAIAHVRCYIRFEFSFARVFVLAFRVKIYGENREICHMSYWYLESGLFVPLTIRTVDYFDNICCVVKCEIAHSNHL